MDSVGEARRQRAWLDAKETSREAADRYQKALDDLIEAKQDEERKRLLMMLGAIVPSEDTPS